MIFYFWWDVFFNLEPHFLEGLCEFFKPSPNNHHRGFFSLQSLP